MFLQVCLPQFPRSHSGMIKVGSKPISGCVKLGLFHEDFEKQDLTHLYHFMSASLECSLPLSPSHRVTSANNRIYANEQLLPVSQTSVFDCSDLMLNNRETITTCTLPALRKFPYQLSPYTVFAQMPMILYVQNRTPPSSSALSLQLPCFQRGCFLCLSPLAITQNLHVTFSTLFSTSLLDPLPVCPSLLFLYAFKTGQGVRGNWRLIFPQLRGLYQSDASSSATAVAIMKVQQKEFGGYRRKSFSLHLHFGARSTI